jgi:hypothetical protein
MFRLTRNHHRANYAHSTQCILVCGYIMGSHIVYSNIKIVTDGQYIITQLTRKPIGIR